MEISTHIVNLESNESMGLLEGYFQLRQSVFINRRRLELDGWNGVEIDQYDKETSQYVVAFDESTQTVVGGARLSPTVHPTFRSHDKNDACTFMILDAALGRLEGIPAEVCGNEVPMGPDIWELTRLSVSSPAVSSHLFRAGSKFLTEQKVDKCLALGSPAVMRLAKNFGLEPRPIGPIVGNYSGRFLAFLCRVPVGLDV